MITTNEVIGFEEGFRPIPYLCSEGYVTVGFGTKLHTQKDLDPSEFTIVVTREIGLLLLDRQINISEVGLLRSDVAPTYNKLSEDRKAIIKSMAYQLGLDGLLKFRKMWEALEEDDFLVASSEMMDSRWARQTPSRSSRHSIVMADGYLDAVYSKYID